MSCSRWTESMSLKLDGRLTQDQEVALQNHLLACHTCQHQWEAMLWASSLLAAEPAVMPPTGFTARVQHVVWRRALRRQRAIGALKVCLGSVGAWGTAAAIALVTLAALWTPAPILAVDLGVPLVADALSFTRMFASAGLSGVRALCTTSTAVTLFGYVGLAVALTASWTLVVARFRSSLATESD
jgi:predicted anti-sigma-YlaC factor YlaD